MNLVMSMQCTRAFEYLVVKRCSGSWKAIKCLSINSRGNQIYKSIYVISGSIVVQNGVVSERLRGIAFLVNRVELCGGFAGEAIGVMQK
jgi:hypothetical protein